MNTHLSASHNQASYPNLNHRYHRFDAGKIANRLADHAEAFCRHYLTNGRKVGHYWRLGDLHGTPGQSLGIPLVTSGNQKVGKWRDFASGEHGDLLDLLEAQYPSKAFIDVLELATAFLGDVPGVQAVARSSPANVQNIQSVKGRRLFSYGRHIADTVADDYLRGRAIAQRPDCLRFHASVYVRSSGNSLEQHPAMLAAITDNRGIITGCARTFLNPVRAEVADFEEPKRVMGRLSGNAIRFGGGKYPHDLIVGEGLENCLSVGDALPEISIASCLTANHMGLFDIPRQMWRIWMAIDNDEAGQKAAQRLQNRYGLAPFDFQVIKPRLNDFNNDHMEFGAVRLRQNLLDQIALNHSDHPLLASGY